MKNNQYNNNNNNNNNNNYTYSKSNYIYPNQNINNMYNNQQSTNINDPDNSLAFNSPLSATINYGNFNINSQRQFDNSSNYINPNDNLSKTLSNRPNENTAINRDSKVVPIKKIVKKAPNNNSNQNRNIINKHDNTLRNKVNKTNQQQNIGNNSTRTNTNVRLINNQNKLVNKTNPNITNTNNNINNINNKNNNKKNNNDDSDGSDDYGNADDDDFNNILRETINIRNTQYNLNMNNNNNNSNMLNNSSQNPFLKSKSEANNNKFTNYLNQNQNQLKNQNINNNIDKNLKNIQNIQNKINEEKKNIINNLGNLNSNINLNNKKENNNIINNNLNKINQNINNNNTINKIKKFPKKINEEKNNVINNLKNKTSNLKLNNTKDNYNNIKNDNLGKINQNINELENNAYKSINNYFDNINLEQDKMNNKISDNLKNINLTKEKKIANINVPEKNIDNKKNYVKLDDFFGDDGQNFETLENKENNLNDDINNMIFDNSNNLNLKEKGINKNYLDNLDILNTNVNNNDDINKYKFNDDNNNNIQKKNDFNIMNKDNINFDNNNLDEYNIMSNDDNINNIDIINNNNNNIHNNNNINDFNNIFNENNNDIQNNNDFNNIINDNNIYNNNKINNNLNYIGDTDNGYNNNLNINNDNNFMNNNLSAALVKVDLDNPETKNQFINLSLSIDNMLKEIKFLERLKSISSARLSYFKKKYQKDYYFMESNHFENIFIDEKNVQIQSPLTLIFHYIFNPDTILPESQKNFFETIFTKRGDQNYSMKYDKFELSEVPKYFDDLSYVNNLFNNFNKNDLNLFLEEINSWKETFSFEQQFKHPLSNFRREKSITMKDVATVYFISPYDLIIDYHSLGSELPLSDTFIVITQYRFHCDINYDCKNGKFVFKTSGKIFNTLQFLKETTLKRTIRTESNTTNKEELQINTWSPLKSIIEYEDKRNQEIVENIYEKYLLNNLNKYSKQLPPEYDIFNAGNEENWNSFSDNNDNKNDIYSQNQNVYDYGADNYYGYYRFSKRDIEDRNMILLKYIAYFIIFLLVCQILWALTYGRFSFRTLFNSFIVILLGYLLIKFR